MTYIGIDPGKKGGFALIREDGSLIVRPWSEQDFISDMRYAAAGSCVACLEHVGAMPGQGVTSMFTFGQSFGFIQGVLAACQISFELVRPQKWKKEFSVTGDKNSSIAVCKRLFPSAPLLPTERCRRESDGMAEALLMAEYARRRLGRSQ